MKWPNREQHPVTTEQLLEIALDPDTPESKLRELAREDTFTVQEAVASNPATPGYLLRELAQCTDAYVRVSVALHDATPDDVRLQLATDRNETVRLHLARWWGAPPEVLSLLADDEAKDVHTALIRNPSTPPEALMRLAVANNLWTRAALFNEPTALTAARRAAFFSLLSEAPYWFDHFRWTPETTGITEGEWNLAIQLAPGLHGTTSDLETTVLAVLGSPNTASGVRATGAHSLAA